MTNDRSKQKMELQESVISLTSKAKYYIDNAALLMKQVNEINDRLRKESVEEEARL